MKKMENEKPSLDVEEVPKSMTPLDVERRAMLIADLELEKSVERLYELGEQEGYDYYQENGQRRMVPRSDHPVGGWMMIREPKKGSELFVAKIPRNMDETHIYPLFKQAGPIHQIRFMLDFNGLNRGFCFIKFVNVDDAKKAIQMFNHYEIAPRRRIGVTESVDNRRLFIAGIPVYLGEDEIFHELSKVVDNLVKVQAKTKAAFYIPGVNENPGFAFAEFKTHRDAAMARRKMIPGKIPLFSCSVHVDWADPEQPDVINYNYGKQPRETTAPYMTSNSFYKSLISIHHEHGINRIETVQKRRGRYYNHFEHGNNKGMSDHAHANKNKVNRFLHPQQYPGGPLALPSFPAPPPPQQRHELGFEHFPALPPLMQMEHAPQGTKGQDLARLGFELEHFPSIPSIMQAEGFPSLNYYYNYCY